MARKTAITVGYCIRLPRASFRDQNSIPKKATPTTKSVDTKKFDINIKWRTPDNTL